VSQRDNTDAEKKRPRQGSSHECSVGVIEFCVEKESIPEMDRTLDGIVSLHFMSGFSDLVVE
jgi:hypothetical protein